MGRTVEELEKAANGIAVELMGEACPCTGSGMPRTSCVQREEERALTRQERERGWERRPFLAYDPLRMCAACAAYWHASMCRIALLDVIRFRAVAEAEAKRKAADRVVAELRKGGA